MYRWIGLVAEPQLQSHVLLSCRGFGFSFGFSFSFTFGFSGSLSLLRLTLPDLIFVHSSLPVTISSSSSYYAMLLSLFTCLKTYFLWFHISQPLSQTNWIFFSLIIASFRSRSNFFCEIRYSFPCSALTLIFLIFQITYMQLVSFSYYQIPTSHKFQMFFFSFFIKPSRFKSFQLFIIHFWILTSSIHFSLYYSNYYVIVMWVIS